MNLYAMEVENRFGPTTLEVVKCDFPYGFYIVGGDTTQFVIGDTEKNIAYSRKTGRIVSKHYFSNVSDLDGDDFE
jgi:hypothetical protein